MRSILLLMLPYVNRVRLRCRCALVSTAVALLHPYTLTPVLPYTLATLQPCTPATLHPYSLAPLLLHSLTLVLLFYHMCFRTVTTLIFKTTFLVRFSDVVQIIMCVFYSIAYASVR